MIALIQVTDGVKLSIDDKVTMKQPTRHCSFYSE